MDRFRSIVTQHKVDWELLFQIAEHNRVIPTLHEAVESCPAGAVPAEFCTNLEASARTTKLQNLVMIHELVQVVELLETHGIRSVQLKGPVLAAELYDNPTTRHYRDLDILIARAEVKKAMEILADRGYEPRAPMTAAEEDELLENDCEVELDPPGKGYCLELHWDVLPSRHARRFRFQSLEERTVFLAGTAFRTFAPEDLLLYLCVHGGEKHLWVRLKWLCDVARLLKIQSDLDWNRVMTRAVEVDRLQAVLLGVYLAWLLLDAPLPDTVLERALASPAVVAQAGLVHGRVFRLPSRMPSYREWRRDLATAEEVIRARGFEQRVDSRFSRYVRTILTPEWTDHEARRFPPFLSFLYYVYRPLRLIRKHKGDVVRHV